MNKSQNFEFKSLITREEYELLLEKMPKGNSDKQTNHYFDTEVFSLKANDISIRVRERDDFSLTYKKKKGYTNDVKTLEIDKDQFEAMRESGEIGIPDIDNRISHYVKGDKLINFLSLSTFRTYIPYEGGVLYIDKTSYFNITDYEIGFSCNTYQSGKKTFIDLIKKYDLKYQKAPKKIKRAYEAYKTIM